MKIRTVALWSVALGVAGFLASRADAPKPITTGEIYVYYVSVCEKPGDSSHCTRLPNTDHFILQSFESMESCMSYADRDLAAAGDPRRLGSCQRMRET